MSRISQSKRGYMSANSVKPESAKHKLSKWKHLVIVFTLILLGISALPNLYQNHTTLLLESNQSKMAECSATEYKTFLESRDVLVNKVDCSQSSVSIRLADEADYRRAKDLINSYYDSKFSISKISQNDQPEWLSKVGGEPIKLGLDLSGGVLVILKVDLEQAIHENIISVKHEVDNYKREQKLRSLSIHVGKDNT
ncbi:MAG: hypothetical protein OQK04_15995, partial [Kangiellaceae bacterium]|nr:hypothetical protein [Kangiellaceae bacterium]